MTTEKAVTIRDTSMTLADIRTLAGDFSKSGFFQDAKDVSQAIVKIMAGRELGFSPVYSMTKIYIVKGHIMVSAEALGAMVKNSKNYDYKVIKLTDAECELQFTESGQPAYLSRFTMEDAKKAELLKPDSGWQKWPRAMLMSKALSQGARIVCPHIIAGVYTPEDFGVEVNQETGEIIEGQIVEPTPRRQPEATTPSSTPEKSTPEASGEEPEKIEQGEDKVAWLLKAGKKLNFNIGKWLRDQGWVGKEVTTLAHAWALLSDEQKDQVLTDIQERIEML